MTTRRKKPAPRPAPRRRALPPAPEAAAPTAAPPPHPQTIVVHVPAQAPPASTPDPEPMPTAHDTLAADPFVGLHGLGAVAFTEKQASLLLAPARDEELDVLPTGEVYPPQVHIRRRLNMAFGPGGWGLRPLANPLGKDDGTLTMPWGLVCDGRFVAMAWGEAEYHATNNRMTWATVLETVKSNALTRCGKDVGLFSECWDRRWADGWRERVCIKAYRTNTPRNGAAHEHWQWRRRDAAPFWDEAKQGHDRGGYADDRDERPALPPAGSTPSWHDQYAGQDVPASTGGPTRGGWSGSTDRRSTDTRPISEPQRKRLYAMTKEHRVDEAALKAHLRTLHGIDSTRDLKRSDYDAVCDWVQRGGR